MRRSLFIVLILLLFLTSCSKSSVATKGDNDNMEDKFIKNMMDIIPQPKKNEFSDYRVMINHFFKTINDNDINEALKCFTINEEYKALDIDLYFKRLQYYKLNKEAPIPTNYSHNYFITFSRYEGYWQKYYMMLLLYSHPELAELEISKETNNWQSELEKLKSIKVTRKFLMPEITLDKIMQLNVLDKAMNVNEKRLIELTSSVENESDKIVHMMAQIVKIGDNWKIKHIGD